MSAANKFSRFRGGAIRKTGRARPPLTFPFYNEGHVAVVPLVLIAGQGFQNDAALLQGANCAQQAAALAEERVRFMNREVKNEPDPFPVHIYFAAAGGFFRDGLRGVGSASSDSCAIVYSSSLSIM